MRVSGGLWCVTSKNWLDFGCTPARVMLMLGYSSQLLCGGVSSLECSSYWENSSLSRGRSVVLSRSSISTAIFHVNLG